MKQIVLLTGAGISAESGLATFRDSNGLWCNHRIEDVATPEAYARDPALVQNFYNMRRRQLDEAQPNAAHHALAELAAQWNGQVTLVTQNVDDLHQRALAAVRPGENFRFLAMHGELRKARCTACEMLSDCAGDLTAQTPCGCAPGARLRPHIVWFGEMPLFMDEIQSALQDCDLFVSIGTSGNVYPAAGFVQIVRRLGRGRAAELNLEPSLGSQFFHESLHGPATEVVPAYTERLLTENQ